MIAGFTGQSTLYVFAIFQFRAIFAHALFRASVVRYGSNRYPALSRQLMQQPRSDIEDGSGSELVERPDSAENQPQLNPAKPVSPSANNPTSEEEERLKAFAHVLDSAIRLPGGFRIGLDGIVGLIPGIGDLLGACLSGYLIYGASKLDIPRSVIVRMLINTAIESVVGLIPVLGDAFDFIFKANERNIRLLHDALEAKDRKRMSSD